MVRKLHPFVWLLNASADVIIFQLKLILLSFSVSFSVHMCSLRAVDFLRLSDLNDAVWLLNLVLKKLEVEAYVYF